MSAQDSGENLEQMDPPTLENDLQTMPAQDQGTGSEAADEANLASSKKQTRKTFGTKRVKQKKPIGELYEQKAEEDLWVEVEPSNIIPSDVAGGYYLVPYKLRRPKWGYTFSLGYSLFEPTNYEPNFATEVFGGPEAFGGVYKTAEVPLIDLQLTIKRNFFLGSVGAELAVGMYNNESDNPEIASELNLIPIRLGAIYTLDNLLFEPYIAPYVSGGVYVIYYRESLAKASFNGNTQVAPYWSLGVQFQLDWIDKISARESYQDSGIESTYIFAEMRQFIASDYIVDPDFGTDPQPGAGIRVEF